MQIKYVGPKPLISHTGIEFDIHKEDKYVYLNIVVQLIKSLQHDYIDDRVYSYQPDSTRLSDDEILDFIQKSGENDLDEIVKHRQAFMEQEIEHDLYRARTNTLLNDEERQVLINNITIMKEYMLQREINKAVYYEGIAVLADVLKRDNIDYVIAPMYEKFIHVFHSVQGMLAKQKFPISTKVEIFRENGELKVKLDIINQPEG